MGHVLFVLMHLAAVALGAGWLLVTVPAHLIYTAIRGNKPRVEKPTYSTLVRCPECRELVRRDATKCKHCGCALVPQPLQ